MEQAIYYPGFEVRDPNWLKFALLYVDKLNPIIPPAGDTYLSEMYRKLTSETDLIVPHRPQYLEGQAATLDAIEHVETVLARPAQYSELFATKDVGKLWKNKRNWRYTLFEDKYTHSWKTFCLEQKIAKEANEGLILEKSLGLLYMSILAHAIAESRNVPALTDHPEMDEISVVTRGANPLMPQRIHVAKGIIQLKLPADLTSIEIKKIIQFRQRSGFKKRLHAFHTELGGWMDSVEAGNATGDFIATRGNILSDFSDEILSVGAGAASLGLSIWLFLSNPTGLDATKQIIAGSGFSIGSMIALRKAWKHTESKRFTRKFVADLERLH